MSENHDSIPEVKAIDVTPLYQAAKELDAAAREMRKMAAEAAGPTPPPTATIELREDELRWVIDTLPDPVDGTAESRAFAKLLQALAIEMGTGGNF